MDNTSDRNLGAEADSKDKRSEYLKYKCALMIAVIGIVVGYKLLSKEIKGKDFKKFCVSLDGNAIFEAKQYLIFFIITLPVGYYLWKSNNEWVEKEMDKYLEEEAKRKKEEEIQKQEEFEKKMRGIHG